MYYMDAQSYDLDNYLGDSRDDLLAKVGQDGYDDLLRLMTDLEPEIFDGAVMAAFGDVSVEALARRVLKLRRNAVAAQGELIGAIAWELTRGGTKADLARRSGLARTTIDRVLPSV